MINKQHSFDFSMFCLSNIPPRDVPFFYPNPPKDGKFLHKGGRIFKSKEPPKN